MKQLSPKQAAIKKAVENSPHTMLKIANYSGYCDTSIGYWKRGTYEPSNRSFNDVMEAIKQLESIKPTGPIKWKPRVAQLKAYRKQGLTVEAIAEKFSTEPGSVYYAIRKFVRAA